MKRKVRDSCGNTRPRETPQAQVRRGGSRTARGKRVPGVEITIQILQSKLYTNSIIEFVYNLKSPAII
ncbi:hypothetical protein KEH51_14015 [[Brevibacterium] frigoritolerans]|uniref:Uncharacterized protein n=1 Tax=Peribacillus frigoritolerans TaxID=450367 RepID=A0A941FNY9_9BACI|nr:hypothetical protein [Peribacillus frigoritolerans]